jgi:hypothetical protein
MSNWLKQSTAVVISFGPFVSPTDAVTLQTGLVSAIDHASTGIFLSKNGGALTIRHATVTASTYDAYGNYIVTLDATDTNTLGRLRVQFAAAASCLPVWRDYEIVAANIYDSFIGGGDVLDVSLIQWLGTAPVALSSQLVQVANSAGTATILADYARRTGDYATVAALSTLQGNVTTILADYARRTGDYATVAALATLQGNVTTILTDYARRTGDYSTVAALSTVQTDVTTLLSRIVGTLLTGNHNPQSGDSFARLGAAGAGLTALGDTRIANLDATISSRLASAGYTAPLNAAATENAVWNTVLASHLTAGTTGAGLSAASAPTVAQIDTQLSGTHGAGSWLTGSGGGGGTGGAGASEFIATVNDGSNPLDGVEVWVTTDALGVNVAASGTTDALGHVTFMLDLGDYYLWRQLAGYNFTNPQQITVV